MPKRQAKSETAANQPRKRVVLGEININEQRDLQGSQKYRPGPKYTPFANRHYNPKPRKRVRRTYSREFKIEVVIYMIHEEVPFTGQERQRYK